MGVSGYQQHQILIGWINVLRIAGLFKFDCRCQCSLIVVFCFSDCYIELHFHSTCMSATANMTVMALLLAVLMDILVVQESRRKKGFICTKTVVFTADSVSRKMSHLAEQSLQNVC